MKKRLIVFLMLIMMLVNTFTVFAYADTTEIKELEPIPEVNAQNIYMINSNTGAIAYEKNADERIYPASLTKLVTLLVAYDLITDYSQQVTATAECYQEIEKFENYLYVTKINLLNGEVITIDDLMYAIAVVSANEATNALAIHLCGNTATFIDLMNKKAESLGATNSHFVNTHGLHDEDHYTTAKDMALIAQAAFSNEKLMTYLSTAHHEIAPTNKTPDKRSLNNTNKLIRQNSGIYYKYCLGGKTGTTSEAGYNLISLAEKDDITFILVTMNAPKNKTSSNPIFEDAKKLYTWGFNNYKNMKILTDSEIVVEAEVKLSAKGEHLVLIPKEPLYAVLPANTDITSLERKVESNQEIFAPVKQGDVLGSIMLSKDGIVYGQADLVAATDVERHTVLYYLYLTETFFKNPWVWGVCIVFGILVIVYIIVMIIQNNKRKRKKLKRRIRF